VSCQAHLVEVANRYEEIKQLGGEVLVVSFGPPHIISRYLEAKPQPFSVVSDPTMAAYKAFALPRTGIGSFFQPRVIWHYVKLLLRGWLPKKPHEGDDVLQLGGDFVLDAQQRIVFSYPSKDAADRPTPEQLLAALRRL
jgi:hypothetical protein